MAQSSLFSSLPVRALLALGTIGAAASAAAVLWSDAPRHVSLVVPAPEPVAGAASPPPSAPPVQAARGPSFDIVHVTTSGSAVIAGRAEAGADVAVSASGHMLGLAHADASGAWMLIPTAPLKPGAVELTLLAIGPSGVATPGEAPVLLVVPPSPDAAPLAVLAPPAAPSRVMQGVEPASPGRLGLDVVDYDDHGAIRFSGTAPARAPLRVYVDAAPVGDTVADADGRWGLAPSRTVQPGVHKLRVDQLMANGHVASRVELLFLRETLALSQVNPGEVVVQPRETLWRLARRAYGSGMHYTVIYKANRDQIRDPKLIYVGQVFTLPASP